tara:strand:+ start:97712 stop:97942 length:231 start_codon:yes stop_codon:yes gene_type:complete
MKTTIDSCIYQQLDINTIDETKSLQELGADELDCVEIAMRIEIAFGIDIFDEDFEQLKTVNELYTYVQDLIERKEK